MDQNLQQIQARKIRDQYTEKEPTKLDELKALDREVKRPANVFAYAFGTVGALVLGSGMSLAMNVLRHGKYGIFNIKENMMVPGILTGLLGIGMVSANYPLYKGILKSRKEQYAERIIALSDSITEDA